MVKPPFFGAVGRSVAATAALAIFAITACGDSSTEPRPDPAEPGDPTPPAIASVEVSPAADTLYAIGASVQLGATVLDENGDEVSDASVAWSSSDETVIEVDADGVALAVGTGEAEVTASVEGVSGTSAIVVVQRAASVEIAPDSAELTALGAEQRFTATAFDANAHEIEGAVVAWASSDEEVAVIDSTGTAVAIGAGEATITATVDGVAAEARLVVVLPAVAASLEFQGMPPAMVDGFEPFEVRVAVRDAHGGAMTGAEITLTLGAASREDAELVGETQAMSVDGEAVFNVAVDRPAAGYTLVASVDGVEVESGAFDVALEIATFSTGRDHVCAITTSGHTYCWGDGGNGRMGDGYTSRDARPLPVPVRGGHAFASLSSGYGHTCALTADGTAYCWGWNAGGKLGDGTTTNRVEPVAAGGALRFTEIAAGHGHTCAIAESGHVYCWGRNTKGQLGDGNMGDDSGVPRQVLSGTTFRSISTGKGAGASHTCAVTHTDQVYCWGGNDYGQLGDGTTVDKDQPVAVVGGHSFVSVGVGTHMSCAITDSGKTYCWGRGLFGQIGDGLYANRDEPEAVSGDHAFAFVNAGDAHTCALTGAGDVSCWGWNTSGQFGDGTTDTQPAPTAAATGFTFAAIESGSAYTCGVTAAGEMYCWGRNAERQLGSGHDDEFLTRPARVAH